MKLNIYMRDEAEEELDEEEGRRRFHQTHTYIRKGRRRTKYGSMAGSCNTITDVAPAKEE